MSKLLLVRKMALLLDYHLGLFLQIEQAWPWQQYSILIHLFIFILLVSPCICSVCGC